VGRSTWIAAGAFAAMTVLVAVVALVGSLALLSQPVDIAGIELIAHRAGEAYAAENTTAAVAQARKDDADRLEFDVQRTSDGALVVVHDADLLRVSGQDVSVGGSTLAQVQVPDIGQGQHVPTLDQFLDAAGDTPLALEIKTHDGDQQTTKEVVALLQKRGAIGRTVLMSLDPSLTELAHAQDPALKTADLVSVGFGTIYLLPADVIAPTSGLASSVTVMGAHSAGKRVWVWSVEDETLVKEAALRGADGLITSDVPNTRRVLEEVKSTPPAEIARLRIQDLLDVLANQ
jgi:glycerophosphoryl diester phosphodiesterase